MGIRRSPGDRPIKVDLCPGGCGERAAAGRRRPRAADQGSAQAAQRGLPGRRVLRADPPLCRPGGAAGRAGVAADTGGCHGRVRGAGRRDERGDGCAVPAVAFGGAGGAAFRYALRCAFRCPLALSVVFRGGAGWGGRAGGGAGQSAAAGSGVRAFGWYAGAARVGVGGVRVAFACYSFLAGWIAVLAGWIAVLTRGEALFAGRGAACAGWVAVGSGWVAVGSGWGIAIAGWWGDATFRWRSVVAVVAGAADRSSRAVVPGQADPAARADSSWRAGPSWRADSSRRAGPSRPDAAHPAGSAHRSDRPQRSRPAHASGRAVASGRAHASG